MCWRMLTTYLQAIARSSWPLDTPPWRSSTHLIRCASCNCRFTSAVMGYTAVRPDGEELRLLWHETRNKDPLCDQPSKFHLELAQQAADLLPYPVSDTALDELLASFIQSVDSLLQRANSARQSATYTIYELYMITAQRATFQQGLQHPRHDSSMCHQMAALETWPAPQPGTAQPALD